MPSYDSFGNIVSNGSNKVTAQVNRVLQFNSTAALGVNGIYSNPTLIDGLNSKVLTGRVYADQTGTLMFYHSDDGVTWDAAPTTSIGISAGASVPYTEPLYARYVRVTYQNGPVVQATFRLSGYLSGEDGSVRYVQVVGGSDRSTQPIQVTQSPKASFQNMKNFTNTVLVTQSVANPTAAPTLATATTGGTVPAATYYVVYTVANANGETLVSPEANIVTTGATSTVTVTVPALPAGGTLQNIYMSTSTGTETKQGSTATTTFTLTAPLVAGAARPTSATLNTILWNVYNPVTAGKTFFLTDVCLTNVTNNAVTASIQNVSGGTAATVFTAHVMNTAPVEMTNIGTEPPFNGGNMIQLSIPAATGGSTTLAYFIGGYEQ